VLYYDIDKGLSFRQHVDGVEWPVYIGTTETLAYKIQVVQALNTYLSSQAVQPRYVDVRWPEHPVYGTPPEEAIEENP
jgi:hypothetical protein